MTETVKKGIKIALIVIVSAALGIVLGYMVSSYELRYMFSREYRETVKGIDIYTCGEVNENNCLAHISMLEYAPDELAECCGRIYFTGSELPIPANDTGFGQALGVTQGNTVYVSTVSFGADVVLHEMFHAYDHEHDMPSANDGEFYAAFRDEYKNIRLAAGNESLLASEFFAEAGAMYIISPFELTVRAPKTYKYFNKIFVLYDE
ncbi:MAG: hypothetical protein K5876_03515 [Ruminiclostridium sp.]|nr:hypothetical protein [Ruminiclostridium sp.]